MPDGLDYDLWTGPAEMKPFNANRLHYNWHWFWNTGNGDLGNQGIHQMDLARWGLGKSEFPKAVQASGGRFGYKDDGETPNTELVSLEFDDALLQFEVRGLRDQRRARGRRSATSSTAPRACSRSPATPTWQTYLGPEAREGPRRHRRGRPLQELPDGRRRPATRSSSTADIEEGHLSSAYCHLGNIAYRLGRKLHVEPVDRVVRQRLARPTPC